MSLNEIGNFLTNFRNEIGESLRTMASKLDISATYLSAIENNKRNIPADFLDKFMEVYNVDEDTKKKLEKAIQDNQIQRSYLIFPKFLYYYLDFPY